MAPAIGGGSGVRGIAYEGEKAVMHARSGSDIFVEIRDCCRLGRGSLMKAVGVCIWVGEDEEEVMVL